MKEVYILNYNTEMLYHFSIDLSDYPDNKNAVIEQELENKGFRLSEVSYMITDSYLTIEEV